MIETELPIGLYTAFHAMPTCGLATQKHIIGKWDDPRYFDDPERVQASIIWIGSGYFEYRIPNYLEQDKLLSQLRITQELSSEAPGYNEDYPSDISFSINGVMLGSWECPGDFGAKRGLFTPDWWIADVNQHGLLKALIITENGTYMDAQRISNVSINDLNIQPGGDIVYRISAHADAEHAGGLSLYGRGFGNYNQDIIAQMIWSNA